MTADEFQEIIGHIKELQEDNTTPKNLRTFLDDVIKTLNDDSDKSIKVDKCVNMLEEILDDPNVQPYVRTQLWHIVSMMENSIG